MEQLKTIDASTPIGTRVLVMDLNRLRICVETLWRNVEREAVVTDDSGGHHKFPIHHVYLMPKAPHG